MSRGSSASEVAAPDCRLCGSCSNSITRPGGTLKAGVNQAQGTLDRKWHGHCYLLSSSLVSNCLIRGRPGSAFPSFPFRNFQLSGNRRNFGATLAHGFETGPPPWMTARKTLWYKNSSADWESHKKCSHVIKGTGHPTQNLPRFMRYPNGY